MSKDRPAVPLHIALAQINTTVGDLTGNLARILDAARKVHDADLIVFPELVVPGYPPRDILYDVSFVEAVVAATEDLAQQSKGLPPMLVGSFAPSGKKLFLHPALHNIAYLIRDGEMQIAQIKQLLPVYDVFYESRWFVPGEKTLPPLEIAGKKIGVLICEDMWDEEYPVHPGAELKAQGADALVCMSAAPFHKGSLQDRVYHASHQGLPIAFVDLVGGNDELVFDGGSFVLGRGKLKRFEEQVQVFDWNLECGEWKAERETAEDIFHALVLGLRDFARKNGMQHAFLGLSGGIDSSVAAIIATEALCAENVTGVAIPSRYTDPRSTEAARELASRLGISFEVVELEPLHQAAESTLGARAEGVGGENLQARLRMMILMSYVNQRGGFLVNTSNKTELTLGYSTLYGDMAGAISPLGDVTKPEVYELARWINEWGVESGKWRVAPIPTFAIERKPSAELRPEQVDPFDYETLAPALEEMVLANESNAAMRGSEHKRGQMGVVLKVSKKAFGSGRMMPITRK
ncbi:MAG: NAD(+) synthase [Chloroflexi bacterium]|nr:NAD(+) synthase [Chloroflexota bacterium]